MRTALKKITVHVPESLVEKAREATGKNLTETIRLGLEAVALRSVFERALKLKGTYHFSIPLEDLREDRD